MRPFIPLFAFSLLTSAASAQGWDQVKGTGEVVNKPLTVEAFHGIVVEGAMNVMITQGSTQQVSVEAQENIAALVTTKVNKGVWTIGAGNKGYTTSKPFVVHIVASAIDVVRIEGSGDVTGQGLFASEVVDLDIEGSGNITMAFKTGSLEAEIQGSGNVILSGECDRLKATVEGSGNVQAQKLTCAQAEVRIAGSGGISLNASESLSATIEGSGDVVYTGKPAQVKKQEAGSGRVRAAD